MKFAFFTLLTTLTIAITAQANNVYLSTGMVYRNVKVDSTETSLMVDMGSRVDAIDKGLVLLNEWSVYDATKPPTLVPMTVAEKKYFDDKKLAALQNVDANTQTPEPKVKTSLTGKKNEKYSNGIFIVAGALGAALAWDYLKAGSDYSTQIDNINSEYDKLTPSQKKLVNAPDTSYLENARTRSYIVGAVSAIVGVVFTVYAFIPVTVSVSPDKINVSYQ